MVEYTYPQLIDLKEARKIKTKYLTSEFSDPFVLEDENLSTTSFLEFSNIADLIKPTETFGAPTVAFTDYQGFNMNSNFLANLLHFPTITLAPLQREFAETQKCLSNFNSDIDKIHFTTRSINNHILLIPDYEVAKAPDFGTMLFNKFGEILEGGQRNGRIYIDVTALKKAIYQFLKSNDHAKNSEACKSTANAFVKNFLNPLIYNTNACERQTCKLKVVDKKQGEDFAKIAYIASRADAPLDGTVAGNSIEGMFNHTVSEFKTKLESKFNELKNSVDASQSELDDLVIAAIRNIAITFLLKLRFSACSMNFTGTIDDGIIFDRINNSGLPFTAWQILKCYMLAYPPKDGYEVTKTFLDDTLKQRIKLWTSSSYTITEDACLNYIGSIAVMNWVNQSRPSYSNGDRPTLSAGGSEYGQVMRNEMIYKHSDDRVARQNAIEELKTIFDNIVGLFDCLYGHNKNTGNSQSNTPFSYIFEDFLINPKFNKVSYLTFRVAYEFYVNAKRTKKKTEDEEDNDKRSLITKACERALQECISLTLRCKISGPSALDSQNSFAILEKLDSLGLYKASENEIHNIFVKAVNEINNTSLKDIGTRAIPTTATACTYLGDYNTTCHQIKNLSHALKYTFLTLSKMKNVASSSEINVNNSSIECDHSFPLAKSTKTAGWDCLGATCHFISTNANKGIGNSNEYIDHYNEYVKSSYYLESVEAIILATQRHIMGKSANEDRDGIIAEKVTLQTLIAATPVLAKWLEPFLDGRWADINTELSDDVAFLMVANHQGTNPNKQN